MAPCKSGGAAVDPGSSRLRLLPNPQNAQAPSTRRLGISKQRRGVKLSGQEDLNLGPFGPESGAGSSQAGHGKEHLELGKNGGVHP
jgi:hypothetical protein